MALIAIFAFGAIASSSAFAVSKLLINNEEIKTLLLAEVAGELLLEDMNSFGKPDILCMGIFDVNIEPGGVLGSIESVLELNGVLVAGPKGSDSVSCEAHSTCSNPVTVEAVNLPWKTEISLSGATYVILILGSPGYSTDCNSFIGLLEDTCTGETGAIATNGVNGVVGEYSETNESVTVPGNCTLGGEKQGLLAGSGELIDSEGGVLSLSE
jgi:hypothetical protein